ncbi:MAG: HAMP domain-containing sensor histidine kinase [Mucilaginibacter sp.]
MKLLAKYNRISLMVTIVVIIITGIIYYFTISFVLTEEIDKDLQAEEIEIFGHVKRDNRLPEIYRSEYLKISFTPVGRDSVKRHFTDVLVWDKSHKERELGRELISSVQVSGINYRISIIESTVETDDLIQVIFLITLGIILLLILTLMVINRLVITNLWKPFYQMLKQIKLFNLTDNSHIIELETAIDEFKDMNQEVTAMSLRVNNDYQELKSFVENASHELMTPLAVINSKLDTLVQSGELTDRQGTLIGEVYGMVSKMRKLNKSMLLLSKIENRIINEKETLDIQQRITDVINDFQELLAAKSLHLNPSLQQVEVLMNKEMLYILLNNLLGNAIRHNYVGGLILITLNQNQLVIANTGQPEQLKKDVIFQRFQKSADSDGSGLGLTLSREICEASGFNLTYTYEQSRHTFIIDFNRS